MKAYSYNSKGIYCGEVERQYDELDKRWLMPAGATDKKPIFESGKASVFNGSEWELKTDNSGIWYNTTNKSMKHFEALDDVSGWTKLQPKDTDKWDGSKWVDDAVLIKQKEDAISKSKLSEIDMQSIRALRACVISFLNETMPPQEEIDLITGKENEAKAERNKLK